MGKIAEQVFDNFQQMSRDEQMRVVVHGLNAEYVLRQLGNTQPTCEVNRTAIMILDALKQEY